jgi:signal transduction histidine kinase
MSGSSSPGGYRLTRYFAIGALIVLAAAAVVSIGLGRSSTARALHERTARHEAALAQAMAALPWPRFAYFLHATGRLEADEIRTFWQTRDLLRDMPGLLAGSRVLRIKLYDTRGLTVFSSDTAEIGRIGYVDPDLRMALGGESAGKLAFLERFEVPGGAVSDRWVLSSYVPLRADGASGEMAGVVELHSDVTDLQDHVAPARNAATGPILATFAVVFGLLLALVWAIERRAPRARSVEPAGGRPAERPRLDLVGHLGHEIRTPLNTILGFAESIKDGLFGPVGNPRYVEYSKDIYNSGQELLKIIDDALDLADLETGCLKARFGTLDPVEAARNAVALLAPQAESAGVELRLEPFGALRAIVSDEDRINQILFNLLSNALRYTPPGGSVTIAMEQPAPSGTLRVAVRDTGVGMKREEVPIALAPFRRIDLSIEGKRRGGGLGLPLSRKLVELLGGELEVETELGIGTTVTFTLPDHAEAAADLAEAAAA